MFKIKPDRTYKIQFSEGDTSFSVTFKFPFIEDMDFTKLREQFKGVKDESSAYNPTMTLLRSCIIAIEDICDEDSGSPILLVVDGKIDENVQKVVFEYIRMNSEWLNKVLIAYLGPKGKNLSAGATQQ